MTDIEVIKNDVFDITMTIKMVTNGSFRCGLTSSSPGESFFTFLGLLCSIGYADRTHRVH